MTREKRVIVCGSREGAPWGEVEHALGTTGRILGGCIDHVVVGSDRGVDSRAFRWALSNAIPATVVSADWTGEGKAAGPLRNRRMLALHPNVTAVLAFPGGRGTEDMVSAAKSAGVPVWRWLGRADSWRRDP